MTDSDSGSAQALIDAIANDRRKADAAKLLELTSAVTGETPRVWGSDTIGFGQYHYRYKTGQEGDFFKVGFSPRKDRLTLYIMSGLRGFDDILDRLGPHRAAKSAVHLKWLADVDREALVELVTECVAHLDTVEESMGAIPRMSDIPPRER